MVAFGEDGCNLARGEFTAGLIYFQYYVDASAMLKLDHLRYSHQGDSNVQMSDDLVRDSNCPRESLGLLKIM